MGRPLNTFKLQANAHEHQMVEAFEPQMMMNNDAERIVYLNGDINEHMMPMVISRLISLDQQNHQPIRFIISTYGGALHEMFALYDIFKSLKSPIQCTGLGKVMSAGVLILSAGTKGYRCIGKHSRIMMHPISGAGQGDIFSQKNEIKEMQSQQEIFENCLAEETGISKKRIKKLMEARLDTYLSPIDAKQFGIVDYIF